MRVAVAAALLSLAVSAVAASSAPVAVAAPEEISLSVRSSGAVGVPVTVNGQGPFTFLLDTGSSHTTLGSRVAERLGLPVVAQVRVTTPAGVQLQPVVAVASMAIGSARLEGLMPSVVSIAELRSLEPGIDGVVGQDFLRAFDYTVDYRRKRLRFTADSEGAHARLPLVRSGERSLVELPGADGGAPVRMVPDSGSEGFVVFERNGRTALALSYTDDSFGVSALSMQRAGRRAVLRELRVGELTLRNQPAVVIARDGDADGLLPLHGFASVSFSNSEGYLALRK